VYRTGSGKPAEENDWSYFTSTLRPFALFAIVFVALLIAGLFVGRKTP